MSKTDNRKNLVNNLKEQPITGRDSVFGNKFEKLNDGIFQEQFQKWLELDNSMLESLLDDLDKSVDLSKGELVQLFFEAATTFSKAVYRLAKEGDDLEELFRSIDWQKHLNELLMDYGELLKALVAKKQNKTLSKLEQKLVRVKLIYLKMDETVDLLLNTEDNESKKIHNFFSHYRITQTIFNKENKAKVWLLEAIENIEKLQQKFDIFTISQIQKVFFDKGGDMSRSQDYLRVCQQQFELFWNNQQYELLTKAYIKKVIIYRKDNAKEYLNMAQKTLQEVYDVIDKNIINVFAKIGGDIVRPVLNDMVRESLRKYLLSSPTISLENILMMKNQLFKSLNDIDWKDFDYDVFKEKTNKNIPLKIKKIIETIFLGQNKAGKFKREQED